MSFVRFVCCSDPVEDQPRSQGSLLPAPNPGNEVGGRIVYQTVLERFARRVFGEFYRSAKYARIFPRSTYMFICWRARKPGTRMKVQASCPNKEFEEGQ